MNNSKEIEGKWQAHTLDNFKIFLKQSQDLGAKLSKSRKVKIKDIYVDTPEKYFQCNQLECRIRLSQGHSELTLKSILKAKDKIFVRDEKTIQLPHFSSKKAALTYCQNYFFKNIQPLFEILNNRQIQTLTLPGGTCAEVSFDQVVMSCGKKKFSMNEIELEFKSGNLDEFKAFVNQVPLDTSKHSKYEVAMSHLLQDSSPCSIDTIQDTASRLLKKNLEKLKENEAEVLTSFNPDAIHDMRVAIRRLRAAFNSFKKVLPSKAKNIREMLQKVGSVLGKKRDLDIFSVFIFQTIGKQFEKLEGKFKKKILRELKSKEYVQLIKSLEKLKVQSTKKNIFKESRSQIRKALFRTFEIGSFIDSKVDDKTLHKLRIAIKKLRYTCEFFEPLYSKYICSLESLILKAKNIQDILGDHQDAMTGISLLKHFKTHFSSEEFLQIKSGYELKKTSTCKAFLKSWKDFWKGFHEPLTAIELIF